jgi:hypothetical protein
VKPLSSRCLGLALLLPVVACSGSVTVDPGEDFSIAEVVYDENFYYCRVEPMLFANKCGPGDSSQGDGKGSCHFDVTPYRLTPYSPLVGEPDGCGGTLVPPTVPPAAAKSNYGASQGKMQLDPNLAPLLNRPIGKAAHPRKIFESDSPPADLLREWATKFSTQ